VKKTIATKAHKCLVKAIRQKREASGLTQIDVAKRLRVNQSWVSKLESGQHPIDVVQFLAFARAIGFDPIKVIREIVNVCNANGP
jgi:transcriptional regulator with XRE-family HTH domain